MGRCSISISSIEAQSGSSDYILVSKTNLLCELEPLISLGFSFYMCKIMLISNSQCPLSKLNGFRILVTVLYKNISPSKVLC